MLRKRVEADFNRRMSHFEAPRTSSEVPRTSSSSGARIPGDTSGRQEYIKPDDIPSMDDVTTELTDDLENSLTTV